jgi:hypothetical protein
VIPNPPHNVDAPHNGRRLRMRGVAKRARMTHPAAMRRPIFRKATREKIVSTVSVETAALLVRIAFLVGAITDGLVIIPMLSRRLGVALFGGDPTQDSAEYRYAMGIGASLMAGWTALLIWGAASPIERRDILLLTVFPVITGIVFATAIAARKRAVLLSRVVPLLIHLGFVSLFYVVAYVLSFPFAR